MERRWQCWCCPENESDACRYFVLDIVARPTLWAMFMPKTQSKSATFKHQLTCQRAYHMLYDVVARK
jgi:hypothetical protein